MVDANSGLRAAPPAPAVVQCSHFGVHDVERDGLALSSIGAAALNVLVIAGQTAIKTVRNALTTYSFSEGLVVKMGSRRRGRRSSR